ncbi:MAG: metallophosphoesterase [Candidatus Delongbacteria bacterium]|nr:metallophosphoesterase [Candidatus Delongbacteria bacterium]
MTLCFFVTDLHGRKERYEKFFSKIYSEKPDVVFLGGDLFPNSFSNEFKNKDFLGDFLVEELKKIKKNLGKKYPRIFVILGNDDGRSQESDMIKYENQGIWQYIHNKKIRLNEYSIYGYSYIPPTPFSLKDWEKYDVSRFVDIGCVSPEEGSRTIEVSDHEKKYSTIKDDLNELFQDDDLSKAVILFHSPPYKTKLDRADLDGKMVDFVPLDVHVGSIAIQRFITDRSPYLTLHGHIHESSRLTNSYLDNINNTTMLNAAHDGNELSLIKFQLEDLTTIQREIL